MLCFEDNSVQLPKPVEPRGLPFQAPRVTVCAARARHREHGGLVGIAFFPLSLATGLVGRAGCQVTTREVQAVALLPAASVAAMHQRWMPTLLARIVVVYERLEGGAFATP